MESISGMVVTVAILGTHVVANLPAHAVAVEVSRRYENLNGNYVGCIFLRESNRINLRQVTAGAFGSGSAAESIPAPSTAGVVVRKIRRFMD
jgi:hypothetical protein